MHRPLRRRQVISHTALQNIQRRSLSLLDSRTLRGLGYVQNFGGAGVALRSLKVVKILVAFLRGRESHELPYVRLAHCLPCLTLDLEKHSA